MLRMYSRCAEETARSKQRDISRGSSLPCGIGGNRFASSAFEAATSRTRDLLYRARAWDGMSPGGKRRFKNCCSTPSAVDSAMTSPDQSGRKR